MHIRGLLPYHCYRMLGGVRGSLYEEMAFREHRGHNDTKRQAVMHDSPF